MAKFYSSDLPEYQVEPESFEFVQMEGEIADEKFQDKPIGFFKDASCASAAVRISIIAFIGIVIVLLFAVFAPALSRWDYNDQDLNRIILPPKVPVLGKLWHSGRDPVAHQPAGGLSGGYIPVSGGQYLKGHQPPHGPGRGNVRHKGGLL